MRFLTGAVMACGGYVLSRRFDAGESAAIEFEFVRATCVEMYSVLIAAGLDLSAQSHRTMVTLCQCTRETLGDGRRSGAGGVNDSQDGRGAATRSGRFVPASADVVGGGISRRSPSARRNSGQGCRFLSILVRHGTMGRDRGGRGAGGMRRCV